MPLMNTMNRFRESLETADSEVKKNLRNAAGIAYIHCYRIGCIVTIRGAHGVILARQESGEKNQWSAPLPLKFGGIAVGADIGLERTEFIFILKTKSAVESFCDGSFLVGLNGCLTLGLGKSVEVDVCAGSGEAPVAISNSNGLYGGVSLEFTSVQTDHRACQVSYNRKLRVEELFAGAIPRPKEAISVYQKLYEIEKNYFEERQAKRINEVPIPPEGITVEATELPEPAVVLHAEEFSVDSEQRSSTTEDGVSGLIKEPITTSVEAVEITQQDEYVPQEEVCQVQKLPRMKSGGHLSTVEDNSGAFLEMGKLPSPTMIVT